MVGFQELSLTAAAGEMILQDICHNVCITANMQEEMTNATFIMVRTME